MVLRASRSAGSASLAFRMLTRAEIQLARGESAAAHHTATQIRHTPGQAARRTPGATRDGLPRLPGAGRARVDAPRGSLIRLAIRSSSFNGDIDRQQNASVAPRAARLPQIFEIFSQVRIESAGSSGGLGIGLSLVKGLVELHGGSIQALSDGPGHGSEFVVRLPIEEPARAAAWAACIK